MKQQKLASFLLIFAVCIWGASFLPTKYILKSISVYEFLFFRFFFAACAFFIIARKSIIKHYKSTYKNGLIVGVCMGAAFILQTLALPLTQSSNVAFLTGLEGIIAPFLCLVICGRLITFKIFFLAFVACFGMFLFSNANFNNFSRGEWLSIACAFFFALLVALNDRFLRHNDLNTFVFFQFFACAIVSLVFGLINSSIKISALTDIMVFLWVMFSALIFTVFCFFVQTYAQKYLHPSKVALILLLEPISAGLIGTFYGESFTLLQILGAGLILLALAFS